MTQRWILRTLGAAALLAAIPSASLFSQQKMDNLNRDRARSILHLSLIHISEPTRRS